MKSNMLTDGLDLHYEKRGEGRPVVFLHGFGATTYSWNHVVPRLAERYTTISFDLKGFGLSPKPADDRYCGGGSSRSHQQLYHRKTAH